MEEPVVKYYVPELDYYFGTYWKNEGEITTNHVNVPVMVDRDFLPQNNFLEMLFDKNFSGPYYTVIALEGALAPTHLPNSSLITMALVT